MLSSLLSLDLESSPSTLVAINHVAPMRMMALRMPMTTQRTVLLRCGGWLKEPEGGTVPGLEGGTVPGFDGGTVPGFDGGTAPEATVAGPEGGTAPGFDGGTAPGLEGGTVPLLTMRVFGEASASGTGGMSLGTGGGVVPLFVLMVVLASALGAGAPHTGHSFRSSGN